MTLRHLLQVVESYEEHGWNRPWITYAGPNQNFTSATLNWHKQFSSNNYLHFPESFHA